MEFCAQRCIIALCLHVYVLNAYRDLLRIVECRETYQFIRKAWALWAAAMSSVLLLMGSNHIAFITIPMLPPCSFWNDIFIWKSLSVHHSWNFTENYSNLFQWSHIIVGPAPWPAWAHCPWFGHLSCWSDGLLLGKLGLHQLSQLQSLTL